MQTPLHTDSITAQTSATGIPEKNNNKKLEQKGHVCPATFSVLFWHNCRTAALFFFFFFWWCRYWHRVCGHSRDDLPGREGCASRHPARQAERRDQRKEVRKTGTDGRKEKKQWRLAEIPLDVSKISFRGQWAECVFANGIFFKAFKTRCHS